MSPVIVRKMNCGSEFAFRFLNEELSFSPEAIDWHPVAVGKLWRYNLHYFDYLMEAGRSRESILILLDSWIASNAPGTVDAWEPFPLSLRIVNWIKLFITSDMRTTITDEWLDSLYDQTLWLEQSVEYHLMGNHYFKNGKALLFAGLFFVGPVAERWLGKGLQILSSEIEEQILSDGGHFERSPMYHTMILEDCLDLLNLCRNHSWRDLGIFFERLRLVTRAMIRFLLGMRHPDGEIALFNDAAIGIEPRPAELAAYYERLTGERIAAQTGDYWAFPESGYFVMAPAQGNRLIIDCGPVGPDYQPGHAHCDTLSFELSLRGRRVIVDSGCCQYLDGDIRRYNRGNVGHNTVTLDGVNQSDVWSAHRCARRARPICPDITLRDDGALHFAGAHDGYRRLSGRPVHHRSVVWHGKRLVVEDLLDGGGEHEVESRLHIHPGLTVGLHEDQVFIRDGSELLLTVASLGGEEIACDEGWYCPEFGLSLPCSVLSVRLRNVRFPSRCGWVMTIGSADELG